MIQQWRSPNSVTEFMTIVYIHHWDCQNSENLQEKNAADEYNLDFSISNNINHNLFQVWKLILTIDDTPKKEKQLSTTPTQISKKKLRLDKPSYYKLAMHICHIAEINTATSGEWNTCTFLPLQFVHVYYKSSKLLSLILSCSKASFQLTSQWWHAKRWKEVIWT